MKRSISVILCIVMLCMLCVSHNGYYEHADAADNVNSGSAFTCDFNINSRIYSVIKKDKTLHLLLPYSEYEYLNDAKLIFDKTLWKVNGDDTGEVALDISSGSGAITVSDGKSNYNYSIVVDRGSADVPIVYINITDDNYSFDDVNSDALHETTAQGNMSIINIMDKTNMQIKGRGNASWERIKKSYQIKLESSESVLGMAAAKKWILLPSSADLSLMRNPIGYTLAKRLDMAHYIDFRYVDIYVDGKYNGLYLLSEKDEITKNRMVADACLEFDNYYSDNEVQFETGMKNLLVTVRTDLEEDKLNEVKTLVNNAEKAIYTGSDSDVLKYVDVDSFAQMWIIKEYMNDHDALRNMHFYTYNNKVYAGQAWDFDNTMDRDSGRVVSAGNKAITVDNTGSTPKESSIEGNARWLGGLLTHDVFIDTIQRIYKDKKQWFTTVANSTPLTKYVDDTLKTISASEHNDTLRWSGSQNFHRMGGVSAAFTDADRAVSAKVVKDFMMKRNEYFAKRIPALKDEKNVAMATPKPTASPTAKPTEQPTVQPTGQPTEHPIEQPTEQPVQPTVQPDSAPVATAGIPTCTPSGITEQIPNDNTSIRISKPKLQKVTCNAKKKAVLVWKKAAGSKGYIVYRSKYASKGFKRIKTIKSAKKITYTDGSVKKNQVYYYKIKAMYDSKNSSFSVVKKVKIK